MSLRPIRSQFSDGIYPVESESGCEQNRAEAIARLGATDAMAPGTFFAAERDPRGLEFSDAWNDWLQRDFEGWLGSKFVEIHLAAAGMRNDRIAEIDLEIDAALSPEARRRSRQAAIPFLEGRTEVRRQPQWDKYRRAQEMGEIPGHLPTVFALQAALFHLPLLPALTAYVNFEGTNGLAASAGGKRLEPEAFADRFPEGLEAARRVFRRGGDFQNGGGSDDASGFLACV